MDMENKVLVCAPSKALVPKYCLWKIKIGFRRLPPLPLLNCGRTLTVQWCNNTVGDAWLLYQSP